MIATVSRRSRQRISQSSADANRRRRIQEATVEIPSLSQSEKKRRQRLEEDDEAWIWEMMGPGCGLDQPLTRKFTSQEAEMIGTFRQTLEHGGDDLILAPRGGSKTTYLRACITKALADGTLRYGLYVGATDPLASYSLEAVKHVMVRSIPFLQLYPEIAVPARAVGNTAQKARQIFGVGRRPDDLRKLFATVDDPHLLDFQWSTEGIILPKIPGSPSFGSILAVTGADSPIRGLNILGKRPQAVFMDDLDTPNTTRNPDQAQKVIDRITYDIGGLKGESRSLGRIMLATLSKDGSGVAAHYADTKKHPVFVVKWFRYLIRKPEHWGMWMHYVKLRQQGKSAGDKYGREAHRYFLDNRSVMERGAEVSNPYKFDPSTLPDGTQRQVSALQNYFDEWADKGEMFCRCELDNELVESSTRFVSSLDLGHITSCEDENSLVRKTVDQSTSMIVRGIDVRKIELHFSAMASDKLKPHRIIDYDVRSHGTSETTVEQAEAIILEALRRLADEWDQFRYVDQNGTHHSCDLTLIDKGWMGNWTEDGQIKTWVTQPVEMFCMERGLRHWLPAKGAPSYTPPAASDLCIVGDNWHLNLGEGKARSCTEVIWNADHWHALVEDLFLLPANSPDRFDLFVATDGIHTNHKALSEHIHEGAHERKEQLNNATRRRKPRFRRDHWWDSCAMMLVAKSVETWLRSRTRPAPPPPPAVEVSTARRRINFRRRS